MPTSVRSTRSCRSPGRPRSWRATGPCGRDVRSVAMIGAGAVWSLALLTKIHAWFLLPILAAWSLVRLPPRRAAAAMAVWTVTGIALFWAGWPWLWYDSWPRLLAYWGTGVERTTIRVAVLRPSLPRSRRPLALSLALLRGDGAGRPPAPGRDRRRPRLERPAGRSSAAAPASASILFFLLLFSTQSPGLRRRAAVPARLPGLGLARSAWDSAGSGDGSRPGDRRPADPRRAPRRPGLMACWRPIPSGSAITTSSSAGCRGPIGSGWRSPTGTTRWTTSCWTGWRAKRQPDATGRAGADALPRPGRH